MNSAAKQAAAALLAQGQSTYAVAAATGLSQSAVSRLKKRQAKEAAVAMLAQGHSVRAIEEATGVSKSAVSRLSQALIAPEHVSAQTEPDELLTDLAQITNRFTRLANRLRSAQ